MAGGIVGSAAAATRWSSSVSSVGNDHGVPVLMREGLAVLPHARRDLLRFESAADRGGASSPKGLFTRVSGVCVPAHTVITRTNLLPWQSTLVAAQGAIAGSGTQLLVKGGEVSSSVCPIHPGEKGVSGYRRAPHPLATASAPGTLVQKCCDRTKLKRGVTIIIFADGFRRMHCNVRNRDGRSSPR